MLSCLCLLSVVLRFLFIKYSDPIKVSTSLLCLICISAPYLHRRPDDTRPIKRWWQSTGGSISVRICQHQCFILWKPSVHLSPELNHIFLFSLPSGQRSEIVLPGLRLQLLGLLPVVWDPSQLSERPLSGHVPPQPAVWLRHGGRVHLHRGPEVGS